MPNKKKQEKKTKEQLQERAREQRLKYCRKMQQNGFKNINIWVPDKNVSDIRKYAAELRKKYRKQSD